MLISANSYSLTVDKSISEIKTILLHSTLNEPSGNSIGRERTEKLLIGTIMDDGFSVIGSSGIEVICKMSGEFRLINDWQTNIQIETGIQKVFKIIFVIWFMLIGIGIAINVFLLKSDFSFAEFFSFILAALAFRFFFHVAYLIARNRIMNKIQILLMAYYSG